MKRTTWYVVTVIDGVTYTVHKCSSSRQPRAEREAREIRESLGLLAVTVLDSPQGIDVTANATPVRE